MPLQEKRLGILFSAFSGYSPDIPRRPSRANPLVTREPQGYNGCQKAKLFSACFQYRVGRLEKRRAGANRTANSGSFWMGFLPKKPHHCERLDLAGQPMCPLLTQNIFERSRPPLQRFPRI